MLFTVTQTVFQVKRTEVSTVSLSITHNKYFLLSTKLKKLRFFEVNKLLLILMIKFLTESNRG